MLYLPRLRISDTENEELALVTRRVKLFVISTDGLQLLIELEFYFNFEEREKRETRERSF